MNRKICRNERHKYSNEEKLALVENENTSALINIAQEDDSNIFEMLQNLGINNLQSIILKMLTFQVSVNCYFCFYFTFTVYTNGLNAIVFIFRKRKLKINLKYPHTTHLAIKPFSFCQPFLLFQPTNYQSLTFFPTIPTIPHPRL